MIEILYVFICGLFFGLIQFSFFFILESNMSSAGLTYLTTTCGWLLGVLSGLALSKRGRPTEMEAVFLSPLLYYAFIAVISRFPYDTRFLPLYVVLIAGSALYGGLFFTANQKRFAQVKHLFFWENNGFMAGILSSFLGVTLAGESFLKIWPVILIAPLLGLRYVLTRGDRLEEDAAVTFPRFSRRD